MKETFFNTFNSNDLEVLTDLTVELMKNNIDDNPFHKEKIVVMTGGMRTYLSQEFAKKEGVNTLCDFIKPWQFIFDIFKKMQGGDFKNTFFDREHITWNIIAQYKKWIEAQKKGFPFYNKLISYIKENKKDYEKLTDKESSRLYELATKIADTLDQYQMYRGDWILAWNEFLEEDFIEYENHNSGKIALWIESQVRKFSKKKQERVINLFKNNIWQIKVWCDLKSNFNLENRAKLLGSEHTYSIAQLSRPEIMQLLYQNLSNLKIKIEGLPKRVFIFGISALTNTELNFFQALSKRCQVYLMLFNPCIDYWGDALMDENKVDFEKFKQYIKALNISTAKESKNIRKKYVPYVSNVDLKEEDYDSENLQRIEGNPLLISLGRQGSDNLSSLVNLSDPSVNFIDAFVDYSEGYADKDGNLKNISILDAIKSSLLHFDYKKQRIKVDANDRSLEIHSCYTKRREVEILLDNILDRLNEAKKQHKDLSLRDMIVMVPTINEYAPYIDAVFGSNPIFSQYAKENKALYSISDRTVIDSSNTAKAVLSLLSISEKKITGSTVISLLSVEEIASKFKLSASDIDVIYRWFIENNVHWGLDDNDVEDVSEINLPFTLDAARNRMLKGYLIGNNEDKATYNEIEGSDSYTLGKLYIFIQRLIDLRNYFKNELNKPLNPTEWAKALKDNIIEEFFDDVDGSNVDLQLINKKIEEVSEVIADLKDKPAITLSVFRAMVEESISSSYNEMPFLTGGLNFCSLVPMRAVPFKQIFILGLNDLSFPREERNPNFNLIANRDLFRRGDRSRSIDDRFLFLEAIMSAKESLYLSYIGQDAVKGIDLNPSAVISELLDFISDNFEVQGNEKNNTNLIFRENEEIKDRLIYKERLNAYDIENYKTINNSKLEEQQRYQVQSFDTENFIKLNNDAKELNPLSDVSFDLQKKVAKNLYQTGDILDTINLSTIKRAFKDPALFFLKEFYGLNIDKYGDDDMSDEEQFSLSSLEFSKIADRYTKEENQELADNFIALNKESGILPQGILFYQEKDKLDNWKKDKKEIYKHLLAKGITHNEDKTLSFSTKVETYCIFGLHKEDDLNENTYTECKVLFEGKILDSQIIQLNFYTFKDRKLTYLIEGFFAQVALYLATGEIKDIYLIDRENSVYKYKVRDEEELNKAICQILALYEDMRVSPYLMYDKLYASFDSKKDVKYKLKTSYINYKDVVYDIHALLFRSDEWISVDKKPLIFENSEYMYGLIKKYLDDNIDDGKSYLEKVL